MWRLLLGQLVNQLQMKRLLPPDSETAESQTEWVQCKDCNVQTKTRQTQWQRKEKETSKKTH